MTAIAQLTLDGGAESLERVKAARPRGIGPSAEAVVVFAREHGGLIRSAQAGRVKHELRNRRLGRWCEEPHLPGAVGCCRYAAGDGREILKRLEELGVVECVSHGLYALLEIGEAPSGPVWRWRRGGPDRVPPFVPGAGL